MSKHSIWRKRKRVHASFFAMFRVASILTVAAATPSCSTGEQGTAAVPYTIAFASFGPLDTDVFIADGDGGNPVAFLADPGLDYNASFSPDEQWVIFTSERNGSAEIYHARPDGSELTRLVDHPAFDDQAALSPDGRYLAFVSSRTGNADIWILDLQAGELRNLTEHPAGDFRPAWSPDGEWIAFSSDRDSPRPRRNFSLLQSTDIYLVRRDGSELRRVTREQGVAGTPTWTGTNTIIYYQAPIAEAGALVARVQAGGTTQLVELDVSTGDTKVLTSGAGAKVFPHRLGDQVAAYFDRSGRGRLGFTDGRGDIAGEFQHANWTADGRRMVYHREVGREWPPFQSLDSRDAAFGLIRTGIFPQYSPDGTRMTVNSSPLGLARNSIFIMNPDGSDRSVLFDDPEHSALAPVWSPGGDRIAFGLGRFFPMVQGFAPADIVVLHVERRELTVLTGGTGNAGFPSWAPDGERLVYRTWRDSGSALMIVDVRTRGVTALLSDFGRLNFPSWSPDGDRILFTSDRDGNYELYTINVQTRNITRLTESPDNDAHGSWSPDGRWIAFSSVRQGFKDEAALNPGNPQASGDLYVMRADGSDLRVLTDNPFEEATPGWAPLKR